MADEQNETKPVNSFDELYPGRFLKAGLLQGRKVTLQIEKIWLEKLTGDKGPMWKGVVTFKGRDLQLALNKTNGTCLKAMFGGAPNSWVGHRVTLYPDVITSGKFKGADCIRIWGSPELEADLDVSITMPRKAPVKMTMHRVTAGNTGSAAPGDQGPSK